MHVITRSCKLCTRRILKLLHSTVHEPLATGRADEAMSFMLTSLAPTLAAVLGALMRTKPAYSCTDMHAHRSSHEHMHRGVWCTQVQATPLPAHVGAPLCVHIHVSWELHNEGCISALSSMQGSPGPARASQGWKHRARERQCQQQAAHSCARS